VKTTTLTLAAFLYAASLSAQTPVNLNPQPGTTPVQIKTPLLITVPEEPETLEQVYTELDVPGWVFNALIQYPPERLPYLRAIYLPSWYDRETIGVLDVCVNSAASHTTPLIRADRHANERVLVYDLKQLAPDPIKLKRLIETWDELAVREARLHVPEINLEKQKVDPKAKVRYVNALLAPHLQEALARHLTDTEKSERLDAIVTKLTKSTGAIYPADFFLEQLISSTRGKYPEFLQVDFVSNNKFTPLQNFLKGKGFFLEQSQDESGDKGAYIMISGITRKQRIVDTAMGLFSSMPVAGTFDSKDSRTRSSEQLVRNLLNFNKFSDKDNTFFFDATEWLVPGENDLVRFVLADNKGNITRVAPPDVVADHNKPDGATHELEMGLSCMSCHWPDGGYKQGRNDMEAIALNFQSGIDFGPQFIYDRNHEKIYLTREETIARLVARFGKPIYDPEGVLGRAERDYIKAVDILTDYPADANGPNSIQRVGAKLQEMIFDYRYRPIDSQRLLLEHGVRVDRARANKFVLQLFPVTAAGTYEDIMLGFIRSGIPISRNDADALHVELARRALITLPTLFPQKNEGPTTVPIKAN
jgi:hypothetical protein